MFVFVGTHAVHASGIPLISEGWHRIDAPMDKDAELRVLVPFGDLIFLQRFPIRTKRAVMICSLHLFEQPARSPSYLLLAFCQIASIASGPIEAVGAVGLWACASGTAKSASKH